MKLVRIRSISAALASLCIGISPAVQAQDAEITELNQRVSELQEAGRTTDAIPFAERASSLTEAEKGPEHPDTAQTLNHLAALYSAMGDYSKAEPLYERALNIIERLPVSPAPENAEFAALNKLRSLRLFNGSVCFLLLLLQGQILLGCRGPIRVVLVHGIFELLVIFLHVLFLLLLVKFVLIFW